MSQICHQYLRYCLSFFISIVASKTNSEILISGKIATLRERSKPLLPIWPSLQPKQQDPSTNDDTRENA